MTAQPRAVIWIALAAILTLVQLPDRCAAQGYQPTAHEQHAIYTINRARVAPDLFAWEHGIPSFVEMPSTSAQPLAANDLLTKAARDYLNNYMVTNNGKTFRLGHNLDGKPQNVRVQATGYPDHPNTPAIESNGYYAWNAEQLIVGLIMDLGAQPDLGHRQHVLGATIRGKSLGKTHREIGVGTWADPTRPNSKPSVINIDTAVQSGAAHSFITGVVYDDRNRSGRYELGEGVGGATVSVVARREGMSDHSATMVSNAAGGYSLRIPEKPQSARVTAAKEGWTSEANLDTLNGNNVAVDFIKGQATPVVNFANWRDVYQHFASGKLLADNTKRGIVRKSGEDYVVTIADGVTMTLKWIAPGTFTMGNDAVPEQAPAHRVTISKGFWMSEFEVSGKQWDTVAGEWLIARERGDDFINYISRSDARMFCARLSQMIGLEFRLPSEAEWEFAARNTTEADERAEKPNPQGLQRMLAWASEMVEDHWHDGFKDAPADGRPWYHPETAKHASSEALVVKGLGGWGGLPTFAKSTDRRKENWSLSGFIYGFRVVAELPSVRLVIPPKVEVAAMPDVPMTTSGGSTKSAPKETGAKTTTNAADSKPPRAKTEPARGPLTKEQQQALVGDLLNRINDLRKQKGKPAFKPHDALMQGAAHQAAQAAAGSFDDPRKTYTDRGYGPDFSSQSKGLSGSTAAEVFEILAKKNSSTLGGDDYDEIGIGAHRSSQDGMIYWWIKFARRSK